MVEMLSNEDLKQIPDSIIVEKWEHLRSVQEFMAKRLHPLGAGFNVNLAGNLKNTEPEGLMTNVSNTTFFIRSSRYSDGKMMLRYTSRDGSGPDNLK